MYCRHSHALPGSQVGDCELGETGEGRADGFEKR